MSAERIRQLAADEDMQTVFRAMRDRLTKKVMAAATSDEDRVSALAEYRAVERLEISMKTWGLTTTKEE